MKVTRTAGVLCRTAHIRTHLTVIDLFSLIQRGAVDARWSGRAAYGISEEEYGSGYDCL
jgi:hypothetical protein